MAATAGKWIVTARKTQSLFRKRSDVASFKALLSRRRDFGPTDTCVPRQFVIIGTTNETEEYFRDATGNRRFWPVRVQHFDLERLRNDRDQLWAEAALLVNGSLRIDPRLYEAAAAQREVS
jgi:predicted P-loop ATPase